MIPCGYCRDCRWWKRLYPQRRGWLLCARVTARNRMFWAGDWEEAERTELSDGYRRIQGESCARLICTAPEFGCVQWEQRESP